MFVSSSSRKIKKKRKNSYAAFNISFQLYKYYPKRLRGNEFREDASGNLDRGEAIKQRERSKEGIRKEGGRKEGEGTRGEGGADPSV